MIRITPTIANVGEVKRIAQRKGGEIVRRKAEDVGREMKNGANRKMASQFDLGRPGSRRRHPGTRRARTAIDYQVDGRELPITVRYRVLGGDAVQARIIFMNYGTSPHTIRPSGNWPLKRSSQPDKLAWQEGEGWVFAKEVGHPGQRRTLFLEEAMREAVAKVIQ